MCERARIPPKVAHDNGSVPNLIQEQESMTYDDEKQVNTSFCLTYKQTLEKYPVGEHIHRREKGLLC